MVSNKHIGIGAAVLATVGLIWGWVTLGGQKEVTETPAVTTEAPATETAPAAPEAAPAPAPETAPAPAPEATPPVETAPVPVTTEATKTETKTN